MESLVGAFLLLLSFASSPGMADPLKFSMCKPNAGSIYDFSVTTMDETKNVTMGEMYRGKVLMVVNVATY